jgi:hypothetical protein
VTQDSFCPVLLPGGAAGFQTLTSGLRRVIQRLRNGFRGETPWARQRLRERAGGAERRRTFLLNLEVGSAAIFSAIGRLDMGREVGPRAPETRVSAEGSP